MQLHSPDDFDEGTCSRPPTVNPSESQRLATASKPCCRSSARQRGSCTSGAITVSTSTYAKKRGTPGAGLLRPPERQIGFTERRRQPIVSAERNNGIPWVAASWKIARTPGLARVRFCAMLMTSVSTKYIGRHVRRSVWRRSKSVSLPASEFRCRSLRRASCPWARQQRLLEDFPMLLLGAVIAPGGAFLELPDDGVVDVPDDELSQPSDYLPLLAMPSAARSVRQLCHRLPARLAAARSPTTARIDD